MVAKFDGGCGNGTGCEDGGFIIVDMIYFLSLIPGHAARWCSMRFLSPFFSCPGVFSVPVSYDRSICTLSLNSLFLTLGEFQA